MNRLALLTAAVLVSGSLANAAGSLILAILFTGHRRCGDGEQRRALHQYGRSSRPDRRDRPSADRSVQWSPCVIAPAT
jgi:hypothetical protein